MLEKDNRVKIKLLIRNNFLSHQNVVNIKLDGKITQKTETTKNCERKNLSFSVKSEQISVKKTYYQDVKQ